MVIYEQEGYFGSKIDTEYEEYIKRMQDLQKQINTTKCNIEPFERNVQEKIELIYSTKVLNPF